MDFASKLPLNTTAFTNGKGLWTTKVKEVSLQHAEFIYLTEDARFGELAVFFDTTQWNTWEDGLIYTDAQWIAEFRAILNHLGFTEAAVNSVFYSEHGMQENIYVSLDVGLPFLTEWQNLKEF
jgi:hypothetical protein